MRALTIASAAAGPIALALLWGPAPVLAIALFLLAPAPLLFATFGPNVQWFGPVITRFATRDREVWLTVDDGPGRDTSALLDLLATHGVRATFFVKGTSATRHPELIEEIARRGHAVANHSHTHPAGTFWAALPQRVAQEIDRCNEAIVAAGAPRPRGFRAPVGMKNPFVHPELRKREMRLIGWSARAFDTLVRDPDAVRRRILRNLAPGAIILMHEGHDHSLQAIERVILAVKSAGYAFVIPDDSQLAC